MDVLAGTSDAPETFADPRAEVRRLRRQLQQEKALRLRAENLGERTAADLYESARELRTAQAELLEHADQARVVSDLARALRHDFVSAQLVTRAAESVGHATQVDRCDVLLVDGERYAAVRGSWSSGPTAQALPQPASFVDLPESLVALLVEAAQGLESLQIDDVREDPRLPGGSAQAITEALRVTALLAVPVAVGDEVVGWLLLSSIRPRAWSARDLHICEGVSHDLVVSLVQVQAFEQQRESMRRLEELDRAKDAFVSTVSHELRTPLTSIVGYLELMAEGGMGPLTDDALAGVATIERNVDRLRGLVEDLLSLSAYDAEEVEVDLRPVDLAEVVADCRHLLAPLTAEKHLEVAVTSEGEAPRLVGDSLKLERVVLNLLSNAVKFSRPGGAIRVGLQTSTDCVVLTVTDDGIGIPAAEQHRLFSRFFRSSLSVADEIQGTGLGLALVRSDVEWHGGTVAITSQEADGTVVTVRLPRSRPSAKLPSQASSSTR